MTTFYEFAKQTAPREVEVHQAVNITDKQEQIIRQALTNFQNDQPLLPLPHFEMRARSKFGRPFSTENTNKRYQAVTDINRLRKKGGGRKPVMLTNRWYPTLKDCPREVVSYALNDLFRGLNSLSDNNTRGLASAAVLTSILCRHESISVKTIMDNYHYSKSQSSKIFNLLRCALALPFNIQEKVEKARRSNPMYTGRYSDILLP